MKSVFVGNMNSQTTEGDLRALFEPFGEVGRIHVVSDHGTGLPRGFAFVEMADDIEARNAIADLNGRELAGRSLTINEAPRLQRSGARGRSNSGPGAR
jgi:RNA recognition motif-containing protein